MNFDLKEQKQKIIQHMEVDKSLAKVGTDCLRKGVGCSIYTVSDVRIRHITKYETFYNGPSHVSRICENIVGGCGCSHAEPRAILFAKELNLQNVMLTCTYSPCTNCANIIIDSKCVSLLVYEILTEHDKRGLKYLQSAMRMNVMSTKELLAGVKDAILRKWIFPS